MRRLLIAAAILALATPALAGQPVVLKSATTDADGVVTLGDIFEGAAEIQAQVIARRLLEE